MDRHKRKCAAVEISAAAQTAQQRRGESLADLWGSIRAELGMLVDQAKADGDRRSLLSALSGLTRLVDSAVKAAELRGTDPDASALHEHPSWPAFIGRVLVALDQHPAARDALVRALEAAERNR